MSKDHSDINIWVLIPDNSINNKIKAIPRLDLGLNNIDNTDGSTIDDFSLTDGANEKWDFNFIQGLKYILTADNKLK